MRKTLLLLITLFVLSVFASTASADVIEKKIILIPGESTATVDGENISLPAPALLIKGRTLVPLRFVSEAFGCDVQWNNDTQTAHVAFIDQTIEITIGKNTAIVNGKEKSVIAPAELINGNTYVPLRFIGENLGAAVDYNELTTAIYISMRTYINKEIGFQVILPADWEVEEETAEYVLLSAGIYGAKIFDPDLGNEEYFNDKNFYLVAESFFEHYGDKALSKEIRGVTALVTFKNNDKDFIELDSIKLLDDGIYAGVFAVSEILYDQYEYELFSLMVNTLQPLSSDAE
jgi:hypothetical protein